MNNNFKLKLDRYFVLFLVSTIILTLSWFVFDGPKTLKIASALFFIVANILRILNSPNNKKNLFFRYTDFATLSLMTLFTATYVAASVGEIIIAQGLLIFAFAVIVLANLIVHTIPLIKSKKLNTFDIISRYLLISFLLIVFFGLVYAILNGFPGQGLIYEDSATAIENTGDILYFSSSIFYSNAIGDIIPQGYSKLLSQIETALSHVLHIILLGILIAKLSNSDLIKRFKKKGGK